MMEAKSPGMVSLRTDKWKHSLMQVSRLLPGILYYTGKIHVCEKNKQQNKNIINLKQM